MGCQVYQQGSYKIYRAGHNYIIHNSQYPFEEKHSHVRNFGIAKQLIHLAIKKKIPHHLSIYLLTSLMRISDDENYIEHLETFIEVKHAKGKKLKYVNAS